MANNRVRLICRVCTTAGAHPLIAGFPLAKYYPSIGWYINRSFWKLFSFGWDLNRWLSTHHHTQTMFGWEIGVEFEMDDTKAAP